MTSYMTFDFIRGVKYCTLTGFSFLCISQSAKADFIYGIADNNIIYQVSTDA